MTLVTPAARSHIDYVILYVSDLDAAAAFYREVAGLEVRVTGDGYVEFDAGPTKLGLYDRGRLDELLGDNGLQAAGEACFVVGDVDAEAERLRAAGIKILSGPLDRPWGHRTLHVAGPDGHVVELAQEIPRAPSE
jgi:lactoylglutathione lyase